jgi:predicted RNA-binding protein with PUA domain
MVEALGKCAKCNQPLRADGRCSECGRSAAFEEILRLPASERALKPSDPDFDARLLCSDGACVGVIGLDGRCAVCGRSYDPTASGPYRRQGR